MYSYRKYVLIQEECTQTVSMYTYRRYVLTQEVCTHIGSMYSQWTCIIAIYSLVHGVGVGFFLEARDRKTFEVEGTGLDTGETSGLFALGVDGEGDGVDCEGSLKCKMIK